MTGNIIPPIDQPLPDSERAILPTETPIDTVTGGVSEKTEVIMDISDFLLSLSCSQPGFAVSEDAVTLSVNATTSKTLLSFLDKIFNGGFYIQDFNISEIQDFLIDPDSIEIGTQLKLGTTIIPLSPEMTSWERWIVWEKDEVFYTPDRSLNALTNMDEFLGMLWKNGVRFGISKPVVKNLLENWKEIKEKVKIASPIPEQDGTSAELVVADEKKQPLEKDFRSHVDEKGNCNLKVCECPLPQVRTDQNVVILMKKKPIQTGKDGLKVTGEKKPQKSLEDKDLKKCIWIGTLHTIRDGVELLYTTEKWFISIDRTRNPDWVVSVSHDAIIEHAIPSKGLPSCIEVLSCEKIILKNSVAHGYWAKWKSIDITEGVIEGRITATEWDIVCTGHVNGGKLFANKGNISIVGTKVRNKAALIALKWKITLSHAEWSTIMGREVEIDYAENCTIIGEAVKVKESKGCTFFVKSLTIESMSFAPGRLWDEKIIVYIPDSLYLRKELKTNKASYEITLSNIRKLQEAVSQSRNKLNSEQIKNLVSALSNKSPLSTEEAGFLLAIKKEHQILLDNEKMLKEQEEWKSTIEILLRESQKKIDDFSTEVPLTTNINIDSVHYPENFRNAIMGREKDPLSWWDHDILLDLPLRIFGHKTSFKDWFYILSRILYNNTCADISKRVDIASMITPLYFDDTISPPCHIDYEKITKSFQEQWIPPYKYEGDSKKMFGKRHQERVKIPREAIRVEIDRYDKNDQSKPFHIGCIHDINYDGLSIMCDITEKYPPTIEVWEKILIDFSFGKFTCSVFMAVTSSAITPDNKLQIGGYYIERSNELKNKINQMTYAIQAKFGAF